MLVLFFAIGVFSSAASFKELQRPEFALRHFIRFVLAKVAVGRGMEIMTAMDDRFISEAMVFHPEVIQETPERIVRMRTKRIISIALAAALILALGVVAYATDLFGLRACFRPYSDGRRHRLGPDIQRTGL